MDNQNQMILFITLTEFHGDVDPSPVEVNPNVIMFMRRTYDAHVPYTQIVMSSATINVMETPEEIAKLQMEALRKVLEDVMKIGMDIVEKYEGF